MTNKELQYQQLIWDIKRIYSELKNLSGITELMKDKDFLYKHFSGKDRDSLRVIKSLVSTLIKNGDRYFRDLKMSTDAGLEADIYTYLKLKGYKFGMLGREILNNTDASGEIGCLHYVDKKNKIKIELIVGSFEYDTIGADNSTIYIAPVSDSDPGVFKYIMYKNIETKELKKFLTIIHNELSKKGCTMQKIYDKISSEYEGIQATLGM